MTPTSNSRGVATQFLQTHERACAGAHPLGSHCVLRAEGRRRPADLDRLGWTTCPVVVQQEGQGR